MNHNYQLMPGMREGQILAGKYRVERVLGAGGMGFVVAAHHLQLDEKVAIKFLLPEILQNAEAVARFAREARAAAKIKSEHVARVIDVGTLDSGAPYTVMEFLDGIDLAAWIRKDGPLSVELAVEFVLQACEAVAEAHALGIVHRDLKPSNLFVIRRRDQHLSVKVLDFGISKFTGGIATSGAAMTRTGGTIGSPLYMSPEQMQAASTVDARTDLWSLGVVLYEALSGVSPFAAETVPEVCARILTTVPAPLRVLRPELPAAVEALVQRCLEKDRERRLPDVGELATSLAPFGSENAQLSARRIAGVLQGARPAVGRLEPIRSPAPLIVHGDVHPRAPAGTLTTPAPAAHQLMATAHPVASTFPGRPAPPRPIRVIAWAAAALVVMVGAVGVWVARVSRVETAQKAGAPVTVPLPPPPRDKLSATAPAAPEPPVAVTPAVETSSALDAPIAVPARTVLPRPRPHPDARPKSVASGSAESGPTPATATRQESPVTLVPATGGSATHCRVASSFDGRGREHFTQICDGN
jgi:serine/threonine-protein kinase